MSGIDHQEGPEPAHGGSQESNPSVGLKLVVSTAGTAGVLLSFKCDKSVGQIECRSPPDSIMDSGQVAYQNLPFLGTLLRYSTGLHSVPYDLFSIDSVAIYSRGIRPTQSMLLIFPFCLYKWVLLSSDSFHI